MIKHAVAKNSVTFGYACRPVQGSWSKKEIHAGNPAVPGNDEVGPGVLWRFTGAARYAFGPAIAQFPAGRSR
jgi:hypothetical protein